MLRIKNIGPISKFNSFLPQSGIVVFTGPNGCGKTTILEAIRTLLRGGGSIPLKDGEKDGYLQINNAKITADKKGKCEGSFEYKNKECRASLSQFVDPNLKTPASADAQRIKTLASIVGKPPTHSLFSQVYPKSIVDELDDSVFECLDVLSACNKAKRYFEERARNFESKLNQITNDPDDGPLPSLYEACYGYIEAFENNVDVEKMEKYLCECAKKVYDRRHNVLVDDDVVVWQAEAERYRGYAASITEVLIKSIEHIECLHIHKNRIYVEYDGRGRILFSDLSHGEKWRTALDILMEDMGNSGFIVLDQVAWEGLDCRNREAVADYSEQHDILICTAESDKAEGLTELELETY